MRAVSLSNSRIISLLNRYYVPVYLSNEDYRDNGSAPPEERALLHRIHEEGYAAKLSVGTVHAFILNPDGHTIDSLHTAQAAHADLMTALLERNVQKLNTPPGDPVIKPAPPPTPQVAPGELLLHLTARYLEKRGDDYALTGEGENHGNWGDLPAVDWVTLTQAQWRKLLPPGPARVGTAWEVEPQVTTLLFTHFYPPTENSDLTTNRIDRQSLRATVVAVENGTARVRLDGALTMKHPFYHKDDANFAEATVLGFLEFDTRTRRIRSLRMATEEAAYGSGSARTPFGVVVRSIP